MVRPEERESADGGQVNEQEAELWAALGTNAILLEASSSERSWLLRERARLWDELATISSPACGQAYRDAARQCRAESDRRLTGVNSELAH